MSLSETQQPSTKRPPYEKPVLRSISLVADQVLGVGCKRITGATSNPTGTPQLGCLANLCRATIGS